MSMSEKDTKIANRGMIDKVMEAVKQSGAVAVDVSSGVESAPGKKDPLRIATFLQVAKRLG